MNLLLFGVVATWALFVTSILVYRWQLRTFAPRRYAELKAAGRFPNLPATWDELWRVWTEKRSDFVRQMEKMARMQDRRFTYGVFVDKHLLPLGFVRPVGQFAAIVGMLLTLTYGILWMIR